MAFSRSVSEHISQCWQQTALMDIKNTSPLIQFHIWIFYQLSTWKINKFMLFSSINYDGNPSARCPRDEIAVPIALLDPVKTADINTQSKVDQYWKRFARRNRTTLDGNYTAGIPADYTAGIPTELRVKLQFGQLWHSWHSNWIHSWYSNWIESEDLKQRTMRRARMKW